MTQIDQQNVPKLRFPGFEGAWEAVPLSERVASIKSGRTKHAEEGEVPVYGSTGLIGFTDNAEFEGQNLLVARVGANAGQLNRADGRYGVTDNTLVVTPTEKIDLGFLESSLRLFNLNRLVFGSGQPLVTGTMLKRLKRAFPTLPEQRKIAGFLGAVDTKIAQLTEKKRLLEDYKRGCMQQLFSQKIRFKDDTGNDFPDWEEKRLGELAKVTTGSSNREDSEDIGEYTFFDRSNDQRWSSKFLFDCEALIVAGEGKDFPPRYFKGKFDLHQRAYAIMGFGKASAKFLFYWIDWHRHHFLKFSVGSTMPSLRMAAFSKFPVSLPHPDEQRKIAEFLSALDRKIDLVGQELTHARTFKRGLLQQMFV